jgi:hypothetical protein
MLTYYADLDNHASQEILMVLLLGLEIFREIGKFLQSQENWKGISQKMEVHGWVWVKMTIY